MDRGAVQLSHTEMKRPNKNEWMDSNLPLKSPKGQDDEEDEQDEGIRRVRAGLKAKRERRQGSSSATLCQVCNIQLNSSAQAQIHYRGKTHQRRLRRLAKAVSAGALSHNQVLPFLGSLPLPGRPHQPQAHAQLEHFLPLRINGSSPLSLFPNFNTMDPVQKAVINHTFGMAQPKRKPIISCNICHLRFNSTTQAEAHYKGHKHARKLKALETQRNRHKSGQAQSTMGKDRDREGSLVGCITVPIDSQLKDKTGPNTSLQPLQKLPEKNQGSSQAVTPSSQTLGMDSSPSSPHQSQQVSPGSQLSKLPSVTPHVDGCSLDAGPAPHSDPQESSTGGKEEALKVEEVKEGKSNKKYFHCPTCKVTVNSNSQLEAHCSGSKHKQMLDGSNCSQSHRKHTNSRRHKDRLAGKPVKAKFTPYNKLHPNAVLATKLALQKQLCKALPAGLLTSPVNPAALCTMTSGPLAFRLPPGPTAIIQGPLISPALFRPAPGPLRATHPPIIFSPY
ncbi:zinc finger protein 385B-like isoform X2 [Melanotaenia boesemani]|uniref:zinc finger protein 385B-like isoform X2 n=1 Tax=Melanotaenia boesemani TaxID=1250792 RepID=UPI001C041E76|nr:zinc finger protein 385B-like isoform X2 [Melanotaenia boesemani]